MSTTPLTSQRALVTGANSGLGRACALALAAAGVRTLLSGRDQNRLATVAGDTGSDADDVLAGDLTAAATLERIAARAGALGGLDILVHAAGIHHLATVAATPLAELDRQLALNLRVPFELTRLLLPGILARRGQIVFVNSSAANQPRAGVAAYAASKAALRAFADSLRAEVNPAGVRVLSVFPGRTATPMQEEILRAEGRAYDPEALLAPAAVAASIVHALEAPRGAEITDLHIRPMRPLPGPPAAG